MRDRLPSGKKLLLIYLLLLGVSHAVKQFRSDTGPLAAEQVRENIGDIQVAYKDIPADDPGSPTLVLLHGSPVDSSCWDNFIAEVRGRYRIIVPDLPGFGGSTREVENYSIESHAQQLDKLLASLDVLSAHVLGYSMGGGVALELFDETPQRVDSLTLVSSIGVQELELLGDYTLNHAVHGAQLFYFWLFYNFTPNFGLLDDSLLNLSYCKNFYETDQRPLRNIMGMIDVPTLILHGEKDVLVPFAAAKEHARLIPHAQTEFFADKGHMFLFSDPELVAQSIAPFINSTESGHAPRRADSTPERMENSTREFDYRSYEKDLRARVIFIIILLAIATLVSEDITCITAGLLVSQGAIGFFPATLGCFLGIFIGDTGLYLIGRVLGVRALRIPPLKWFVDEQKIERSKKFFARYGPILIVVTRWLPGMRIPTYVAGGMLKLNFLKFLTYFIIAAALWTPALVGISTVIGDRLLGWLHQFEQHALLILVAVIVVVLFAVHLALALATHRGRRSLVGKWKRRLRWEFWPSIFIYTPVAIYIVWLVLKHRSASVFTAANPGIPHGGIALESKSAILDQLAPEHVARFKLIPSDSKNKLAHLEGFTYPLVLKPDTGERGQGVAIIRDQSAALKFLASCPDDVIAQQFIPGDEIGVLYQRHPDEQVGRVTSITNKIPTAVTGDGERTLEFLILDDPRAVLSAKLFLKMHAAHLDEIPAAGEVIQLSHLGTHSRGALFLDGSDRHSEELTAQIDAISKSFRGFNIGRYDLRKDGDQFKVIELNGVTSEPAHIYDPKHGYIYAVRSLCQHWKSTFEIG
ncbi:MAG: pimeloyl-ACP methyl ester carboxylesterase/membrane protein DedA with SNARE-associated domain, partial [Pseudoalteromonas tetraodonis]